MFSSTQNDWIHCFIGLLMLPILLYDTYIGGKTLLRHLYLSLLDPAPPWNLNKVAILYYPRHYRKHGRFKFHSRYQLIKLHHLWLLVQLLLSPSAGHTLHPTISTKLRHIRWSTDAQPPWTLPYFDINTSAMGTFDPSRIMNNFRTRRSVDWGSPAAEPFRLQKSFIYDPPPEYDPSDIMHIMHFGHTRSLTRDDAPLFFTMMEHGPSCYTADTSTSTPPLIADTGASTSISPLRSDFATYHPSTMKIRDLSTSNRVTGEGMIHWHVLDLHGNQYTIKVRGCHIPQAEVRLLSPQSLLATVGGTSTFTSKIMSFILDCGVTLEASFCPRTNLPHLQTIEHHQDHNAFWTATFEYNHVDVLAYPSLLLNDNTNLTAAQKEILHWHHRLSHASVSWIQYLMRDRQWLRDHAGGDNTSSIHSGPFLPCATKAQLCDVRALKCAACLCAKANRRPHTARTRDDPDRLRSFQQKINGLKEKTLKTNHLHPGDCVSADHYLSPIQGRLYNTFGREQQGYTCGTLFVDHASGKMFNLPQLSTTANDTITSKRALERLAFEEGIRIKAYHSDNGIFASDAFRRECTTNQQKLTFSGVGAHHQNGVAERNIKTISQWARANMLHAAYHWHEYANIKLWPQAVDYAVWIFNRLPDNTTGLTPNEVWSQTRQTVHDLRRARPFGCPVYVLDPKLQDGNKIPKWDPRARRGMFVGFSTRHSSLVPLCLNLQTGKITPQFHVVFDEQFQTVASLPTGTSLHDQWSTILQFSRDLFDDDSNEADTEFAQDAHNAPATNHDDFPHLPNEFIDWFEGRDRNNHIPPPADIAHTHDTPTADDDDPVSDEVGVIPLEGDGSTEGDTDGDTTPEGDAPDDIRPSRNTGTWKDGPANIRKFPIDGEEYDFSFHLRDLVDPPVSLVASRGHSTPQPPPQRLTKQFLQDCTILQHEWTYENNYHSYFSMDFDFPSHIDNVEDPRVFEAHIKTSKYNDDNPSFDMAVNGPYQAEYWEAMRTELHTIAHDFKCWTLVPRTPDMHVLPSTWAFKVKRYPDGSVKKFKARFCARGDCQLEGVDYFETWAPVVQWSTIRIVMIITAKLGWCSAQCDITAAFIHAFLPPDEHIYVEQPRGFSKKPNHVLRLNRSLYGLKQAPRHFFTYLSERLVKHGLQQSQHDPCLFMNNKMIVIVYVDDLLIYAPTQDNIDKFISSMQRDDICLRREGTAEGYLGVDIKTVNGNIHLTQTGLSRRIIAALGLSKYSNSCQTPADVSPLPKDFDGERASGTINYASVVGMLLYLCGHSRPDLSFAVHQCARYTFAPTKRHTQALLRIGHYLKGTIDNGLILDPSHPLHLDCYPDADFAGTWKTEDPADPHCVRSRTGYVITLAHCPVIWASKMQTEIALSTMEAEYIALSTACRDLFPLMDKLVELTTCLDLPFSPGSNMHVRVHEDNVGALVLGKLEPRRMTPRSKHYAVKYHWFREHLGPRNIELVKIASENQLGDIFTKGLGNVAFKRVRKQLMGW